eukprot:TRINITY_DN18097_c0_g1_i1.p1 TRINITY_DN18097_c0_g1~~TRINITY_DN18097_c0_g1_i1.p1  ORF type:complete len:266 (-),score=38.43 TRINITY_DN18097_c0_g1_i1:234-947(-)
MASVPANRSPWKRIVLPIFAVLLLAMNLMILSFVALSCLLDPDGLVNTVQREGTEPQQTEIDSNGFPQVLVTRLQRDLARSSAPAGLALAFVCAQGLWKPMSGKRDALVVLTVFHTANLVVLAAPYWERRRLSVVDVSGHETTQPSQASELNDIPATAFMNLVVGIVAVLVNLLGVFACKAAIIPQSAAIAPDTPNALSNDSSTQLTDATESTGEGGDSDSRKKGPAGPASAGKKKR